MAHDQEMFEKVEYLREKADIRYEEAVQLLERYDGDLTRALIELERSGRIWPEPASAEEYGREDRQPHAPSDASAPHDSPHETRFLTILFKNKLEILKGGNLAVSLPIAYYLLFAVLAPHLFFLSIALMFFFGYTIRRKRDSGTIREEDMSKFAAKAARNIRTTADSFTQTLKQEKSHSDESSEEESEVTVD